MQRPTHGHDSQPLENANATGIYPAFGRRRSATAAPRPQSPMNDVLQVDSRTHYLPSLVGQISCDISSSRNCKTPMIPDRN